MSPLLSPHVDFPFCFSLAGSRCYFHLFMSPSLSSLSVASPASLCLNYLLLPSLCSLSCFTSNFYHSHILPHLSILQNLIFSFVSVIPYNIRNTSSSRTDRGANLNANLVCFSVYEPLFMFMFISVLVTQLACYQC